MLGFCEALDPELREKSMGYNKFDPKASVVDSDMQPQNPAYPMSSPMRVMTEEQKSSERKAMPSPAFDPSPDGWVSGGNMTANFGYGRTAKAGAPAMSNQGVAPRMNRPSRASMIGQGSRYVPYQPEPLPNARRERRSSLSGLNIRSTLSSAFGTMWSNLTSGADGTGEETKGGDAAQAGPPQPYLGAKKE